MTCFSGMIGHTHALFSIIASSAGKENISPS
ncbi:unknown [Alistipes sp. CAG:435]|nr:unknown [Alistipes sp. CAG:435]